MSSSRLFSQADAAWLRQNAPAFCWPAFACAADSAPPQLTRYLSHYGFDELLDAQQTDEYQLSFANWRGFSVARHSWRRQHAQSTVVVVHGLFDHAGLYLPLVQRLLADGHNVVAFDLPGHGLSSGRCVSIGDFSQYRDLLSDCIGWSRECFTAHCHVIGQSTGCSAILALLQTGDDASVNKPDQSVLLAPLVRVYSWTSIKLLSMLFGRVLVRVHRHFGENSHDARFLHFLEHEDPLQSRYVDVQWVRAMLKWAHQFAEQPAQQDSLLVVQGTSDRTVDWRKNIPLIQQQFPNAQLRWLEDARHHLVNEGEPWREQVFDAVTTYLNR